MVRYLYHKINGVYNLVAEEKSLKIIEQKALEILDKNKRAIICTSGIKFPDGKNINNNIGDNKCMD